VYYVEQGKGKEKEGDPQRSKRKRVDKAVVRFQLELDRVSPQVYAKRHTLSEDERLVKARLSSSDMPVSALHGTASLAVEAAKYYGMPLCGRQMA
jgi:hypothetical protein